MSEEAKMWIGLVVFMGLPPLIMALAWLTDRLTDRPQRPTDRATE
jgi:hypothetical protein